MMALPAGNSPIIIRFRMQPQLDAGGARRALAGVVVRSGADAAKAEHGIARGKGTLQRCDNQLGLIPQILCPGQLQAALLERGDGLGKMLVLALAGQDLIADDDCAEFHGWITSGKRDSGIRRGKRGACAFLRHRAA
jgi:hypothetical protein